MNSATPGLLKIAEKIDDLAASTASDETASGEA